MIGRLICWWKGEHLRGKLVNTRQLDKVRGQDFEERSYACPRCGAVHHRRVKRFPKAAI